jgi:8-oxo-dGTP diphosphatase
MHRHVTGPSGRSWQPDPVHLAVDLTLCTIIDGRLHVRLYRRPYPPAAGVWGLPGSFTRPGETLADTARRAMVSKAGIEDVWLEQLATYDQQAGDDVRVCSVVHLALVAAPESTDRQRISPVDDATQAASWWPVDALPTPLAFEHERFVHDAVARLRSKTRYAPVAFQLLGARFTLAELQAVHEAVLGAPLDVRNFRRDVLASGAVEPTGDERRAGRGRPARLYRHRPAPFAVDASERRTALRIAGDDPASDPTCLDGDGDGSIGRGGDDGRTVAL